MAGEKVLLVDDEIEFTQALSDRMRTREVDVDAAASGEEALAKVAEKSYDAVVLDLAMPEMDGMETLRRLLKIDPDLQVIMLTGHATLQKGVEAVKIGAREFMEKPADLNELMNRIRQARTTRMALLQKRAEDRIQGILEDKSW